MGSRVPVQPLPALWTQDFGPRLEELLDLEARVSQARFPGVASFTDNFTTSYHWGRPGGHY